MLILLAREPEGIKSQTAPQEVEARTSKAARLSYFEREATIASATFLGASE